MQQNSVTIDFPHIERLLGLKSHTSGEKGCIVWVGTTINCRGVTYGRVKTRLCKTGPCKNYYVHRLAYMMHTHTYIDPHEGISHLCGNGLCLNGEHLSQEPHSINCERRFCHAHNSCNGHTDYPDCIVV